MARAIDAYEGLIETVLIGTRIDTPSLDLNI
jgi:hypothetical protein